MTTTSIPAPGIADRVEAARRAQHAWAHVPVKQRLVPVRALRHLLVAECANLCAAVERDLGKLSEETIGGDILPLAEGCRFLERRAARLLGPRRVPWSLRPLWLWRQRDTVHRRPRGIVGIVGTWNYPLFLNGVQIAQAATAGNAVLWKPSEVAPASAAVLHALLGRAGFPPDLVQMLVATPEAGEALCDADIQHVVFTGSAGVGRRIASHLGKRLVSSTLELSGCDPLFVLDDADVSLAARAAWFGAVLNRGQTCLAVRRVFVDQAVYPAFCETLSKLAAGATPLHLALASQVQQAERLVQEAVARGGKLLSPPRPAPSNGAAETCLPAVIADVGPEMALCREASFAPLLAVLPFDTIETALDMNGQCPYALGASIFTTQPARAEALAAHLRTGAVTVNDVIVPTAHPATGFGGSGDSGWGKTQGEEGLLEMTVPQVVSVRGGSYRPHYDAVTPAGIAAQGDILRGFLHSGHAATFGQRFLGWLKLLRAMWKGV
jgi:acyl-CoA reductase-like NAD-dependent aldehyde dehydrogenase